VFCTCVLLTCLVYISRATYNVPLTCLLDARLCNLLPLTQLHCNFATLPVWDADFPEIGPLATAVYLRIITNPEINCVCSGVTGSTVEPGEQEPIADLYILV
jgi:hypothetical protein